MNQLSASKKRKLLHFNNKKENNKLYSPTPFDLNKNSIVETQIIKSIKYSRRIPKIPYKILDAPGIIDNFYMNILDWSSTDFIGISLMDSVYLWKNKSSENKVITLVELSDSFYCSIKFSPEGNQMACGDGDGFVHIYDI